MYTSGPICIADGVGCIEVRLKGIEPLSCHYEWQALSVKL